MDLLPSGEARRGLAEAGGVITSGQILPINWALEAGALWTPLALPGEGWELAAGTGLLPGVFKPPSGAQAGQGSSIISTGRDPAEGLAGRILGTGLRRGVIVCRGRRRAGRVSLHA